MTLGQYPSSETSEVGEKHMASVIECVHKKCQKINKRLDLIIQKCFMMNLFSKLYRKVPLVQGRKDEHSSWLQQQGVTCVWLGDSDKRVILS